MRVKIVYDGSSGNSVFNDRINTMFKVRLNKMPEMNIVLNKSCSFYIDNAQINTEKKNLISFRLASPGEAEEQKAAIVSNILRGIGFVLMAIFLPFAFMRFKNTSRPYTKIKFEYSASHDFVLLLSPSRYAYAYEQAISEPVIFPELADPAIPAPQESAVEIAPHAVDESPAALPDPETV